MRAAGITPEPHPSQAVLRRVNHRLFAHEVGGGLPGQAWVRTRVDLEAMIHSGKWMLKRPLAFAGRGQLRVNKSLSELDEAWISASLREDGLIVEPLVVPARELSIHGFLRSDGRFEIGRACEQAVSARGVFRGMSLAQECPSELHDKAEHVAHALKEAGYFGPFGIDSYMHADGFCALSEINARYTMGFALGFPRPSHMLTAQ